MRIQRFTAVPAALVVTGSLLAGCGGNATKGAASSSSNDATSSSASGTSASSGGGTSASATTSSAPIDCPSTNTRKFAKTRFVTDVGLVAGTFHRYIYKPYEKGSFKKGHVDKTDALKAGVTAAVDYKLLKNASENAKANPTLCKSVAQPLSEAMAKLKEIDSKQLLLGNAGGLVGAETALKSVLKGSNQTGNQITESDSLDQAKKAVSNN